MVKSIYQPRWRHHQQSLRLGASALVLTAALLGVSAASAEEAQLAADAPVAKPAIPAAKSTDATAIEEVVVTARRREEKAQDVPIPLTVLGGDALKENGTTHIEDIGALLPSVNVTVMNPRQNSIAVRGLGNNPANDGLESSTGVFLDGVYLGRPGMAVFDLNDIEQLELLRGPQGTLFGKNTTAGALNITTKKPTFTPGGDAEITYGNYLDREFKASINGGLIDNKVAARLSVYDTKRAGVLKAPAVGGSENYRDRAGARGQLLLTPNDDLSVRVIGEYNKEGEPCCQSTFYKAAPNNTFFSTLNTIKGQGYPIIIPSTDPYSRTTNIDGYQKMQVEQNALTVQADYALPKGFELTSISAYRGWHFSPWNDGDSTNLPISLDAGVINTARQASQELRIASPAGQVVDYTGGLYYFWQDQHTNQYGYYGKNTQLLTDWYGATGPSYANKQTNLYAHLNTASYAGFGQADWHVTDQLKLTGGLRNTYERKEMALNRNLAGTQANAVLNPSLQTANVDTIANNLSGTLQADYKWNDSLNTYTSFAHGAKAGATNNSPPAAVPLAAGGLIVQPEKANDVEAGFKSNLFDRKVQLNGNLFYTLIQDYQATTVTFDPATGLAGSTLANTGWVVAKGAEVDSTWHAAKGLSFTWAGGYNLTTYRSFRNGPCAAEYGKAATATCDLTGRPVVGAPKWTTALTANYTRNIADNLLGYIIGEYTYKGSNYGFIDDSAYSKIDGYGVTNLRIGVKLENEAVDVSLWARNLFDTNYYTTMSTAVTKGAYFGYVGDPQTFGATLRVKF